MLQFLILIHIVSVFSHSWIHCLDYPNNTSLQTIDDSLCRAWPRGMKSDIFGQDRGMNYQPQNDRACRDSFQQILKYAPRQKIRLLWPAKNHQADTCTNPYIPKGTLGIYSVPVQNWNEPDLPFSQWNNERYLLQKLEFQNCPHFCENMDKAACFGDLTLPQQPGKYKMNWIWLFNPGQYYTHCFDIEIVSPIYTSSPPPSSRPSLPSSKQWSCKFCECTF